MEIRKTIETRSEERMRENTEDQWAPEVLGRVKDCSHFVVADGHYQVNCYAKFCTQRDPKRRKTHKLVESLTQRIWKTFRACDWL